MNKICTTIEQSQKLIELGVDIKTADMFYMYRHWEIDEETVGSQSDASIGFDSDFYYGADNGKTYHYIPAWSLAALLDVLPLEIETHKQTDGYKVYYYVDLSIKYMRKETYLSTERYESLVDACYNMIVKLKNMHSL